MAPRLTEVFVIKEAQKLTFQQLKQKNPAAAKSWEEYVKDVSDEQDDPNTHEFELDGLKLSTPAGGGFMWDPVQKAWDSEGNFPAQKTGTGGPKKLCKSCQAAPAQDDGYCDSCFPSDGSSNKF